MVYIINSFPSVTVKWAIVKATFKIELDISDSVDALLTRQNQRRKTKQTSELVL